MKARQVTRKFRNQISAGWTDWMRKNASADAGSMLDVPLQWRMQQR